MSQATPRRAADWVNDARSYVLAWGLPSAALAVGIFLEPGARTLVWAVALVWMGAACLMNARRCGRRHCYLTGPFFLIMAVATLLHGSGAVWLGPNGWLWLGATIIAGGYGALWYLPERIWGKYRTG
jgi:hypothetical protein